MISGPKNQSGKDRLRSMVWRGSIQRGFSGPAGWTEFLSHRMRAVVTDLTRPPAGQADVHGVPIAAAAILLWLLVVGAGLAHAKTPAAPAMDHVAASVWVTQQSDLCAVALRQAEQRYHLPSALLVSIARAESGRPITSVTDTRPRPWTIDADGNGL